MATKFQKKMAGVALGAAGLAGVAAMPSEANAATFQQDGDKLTVNIQQGNTLTGIAKQISERLKAQVTAQAVAQNAGIKNPDRIRAGTSFVLDLSKFNIARATAPAPQPVIVAAAADIAPQAEATQASTQETGVAPVAPAETQAVTATPQAAEVPAPEAIPAQPVQLAMGRAPDSTEEAPTATNANRVNPGTTGAVTPRPPQEPNICTPQQAGAAIQACVENRAAAESAKTVIANQIAERQKSLDELRAERARIEQQIAQVEANLALLKAGHEAIKPAECAPCGTGAAANTAAPVAPVAPAAPVVQAPVAAPVAPVAAAAVPTPPTRPRVETASTHTVRSGESLCGIADDRDVSAKALAAKNNISGPDFTVHPGQRLNLTGLRKVKDGTECDVTVARTPTRSVTTVTPGRKTTQTNRTRTILDMTPRTNVQIMLQSRCEGIKYDSMLRAQYPNACEEFRRSMQGTTILTPSRPETPGRTTPNTTYDQCDPRNPDRDRTCAGGDPQTPGGTDPSPEAPGGVGGGCNGGCGGANPDPQGPGGNAPGGGNNTPGAGGNGGSGAGTGSGAGGAPGGNQGGGAGAGGAPGGPGGGPAGPGRASLMADPNTQMAALIERKTGQRVQISGLNFNIG